MNAAPGEGDLPRAAELDREHHGWPVQSVPPADPAPTSPGPTPRELVLIGSRHWTYGGRVRVGLLADDPGPWRGREYHVPAETVVRLMRPIKKGVPRARQGDYPIRSFGPQGGAS